ncbi:hypothetical protein MINS_04610 [Mycolicibacterium insubricum]|uniref:Uncharacterized protein n=1 Tax=Mycolicibacterium insubricum TaxID=444597 RepID=A0A1X0CVR8_9MYCO|nr:DUF3298 domain-containing protein [Mycolicibacterium insubricum]MCB9439321.1 DUF3298 domain-containing protein [Mycolicibacterium sp.]MCV7082144.1 DUF3298 domain-containing protein [Mycolicibacterium insubricum]ORA64301.1 hypothetical protein BST26_19895 [Mycolicibacterium insubricum]BBZ65032.1 hypothetical protein MINS_04610 [Mycolicibacterium insubricum]
MRALHTRLSAALLTALTIAAPYRAAADPAPDPSVALCSGVGGTWDAGSGTCALLGRNTKKVTVDTKAQYPADLIADPTSGPPLREFITTFFKNFGHPREDQVQNGDAQLTYAAFRHGTNTRSVLFTNDWYLGGAHPNDDITTFTFDLDAKKPLALADLFCAADPKAVLDPLVKKHVWSTFDTTGTQSYPDYTRYTDDYRAWVLDGDDLVIRMPAGRTGPMHAGMFVAQIPLSELRPQLRDGGCAA